MKSITIAIASVKATQQIGSGICQTILGIDLYDLTRFDMASRDVFTPALFESDDQKSAFLYKTCDPAWTLSSTQTSLEVGIDSKGTAFWADNGKFKYSFNNAVISLNPSDSNGWSLVWTSQQQTCGESLSAFTVTLNAACDESAYFVQGSKQKSIVQQSECSAELSFRGPEACRLVSLDFIPQIQAYISPFVGLMMIVFGILMTFNGAKFIFQVFGGIIMLFATAFLFMLTYKFVLPKDQISIGLYSFDLLICLFLGAYVSYYSTIYSKTWAVPLFSAWLGLAATLILSNLLNIKSGSLTLVLIILGSILGAYFGKKLNLIVRSLGTAVVGSGFIIKGVNEYLGGVPSTNDISLKPEGLSETVYLYFAGFVILALYGSYY